MSIFFNRLHAERELIEISKKIDRFLELIDECDKQKDCILNNIDGLKKKANRLSKKIARAKKKKENKNGVH